MENEPTCPECGGPIEEHQVSDSRLFGGEAAVQTTQVICAFRCGYQFKRTRVIDLDQPQ